MCVTAARPCHRFTPWCQRNLSLLHDLLALFAFRVCVYFLQDIELLTNAVEKERKNVERGVGGRERKQVR